MALPSAAVREAYIRQIAKLFGIDPEVAVRVARSEGLQEGTWQSNVKTGAGRPEPSYGDFQLNTAGGLGTQFQNQTRLNPTDPANWQQMNYFALQNAAKHGWGNFHGAANTGIGNWQGITGGGSLGVKNPDIQWVIQNQSGTRNQPLSDQTLNWLNAAGGATGLQAYVFSGGQEASGPHRTGSHRHDEGGAADIKLYDPQAKRYLDMRIPADQARFGAYVKAAGEAGATGIGAGVDYMGPSALHVGGGKPAVWGAGGKSFAAPDWLREAYYSIPSRAEGGPAFERTVVPTPQGPTPAASGPMPPVFGPPRAPAAPVTTPATAPVKTPLQKGMGLLGALGSMLSQPAPQAQPPAFQGTQMRGGGDLTIPQTAYPTVPLPQWDGGFGMAQANPEDARMKQLLAMLGRG